MRKTIIAISAVAIAVLVVILFLKRTDRSLTSGVVSSITSTGSLKTYTLTDISAHHNRNDCWMAIEAKVYDVSSYVLRHPGGEAILSGCGKDATDLFNGTSGSGKPHSDRARSMLDNFLVGSLSR